ncbi:hypothetical protein ACFOSO_20110 [Planomonospora venezuelensis]|uniref:Uncharacterized protein n=2 Tax=Planomonospora venezuelensis TaxID=1999 RepID=A0A841CTY9_PLAVE|nr:hypothetical protein [Planomonospora venezuelensis]
MRVSAAMVIATWFGTGSPVAAAGRLLHGLGLPAAASGLPAAAA